MDSVIRLSSRYKMWIHAHVDTSVHIYVCVCVSCNKPASSVAALFESVLYVSSLLISFFLLLLIRYSCFLMLKHAELKVYLSLSMPLKCCSQVTEMIILICI
jgi:hypothetical protein